MGVCDVHCEDQMTTEEDGTPGDVEFGRQIFDGNDNGHSLKRD